MKANVDNDHQRQLVLSTFAAGPWWKGGALAACGGRSRWALHAVTSCWCGDRSQPKQCGWSNHEGQRQGKGVWKTSRARTDVGFHLFADIVENKEGYSRGKLHPICFEKGSRRAVAIKHRLRGRDRCQCPMRNLCGPVFGPMSTLAGPREHWWSHPHVPKLTIEPLLWVRD